MIQIKFIQSPDFDCSGTYTSLKHNILIGRSKACDLVIKDRKLEKKHAAISAQGNSFFISSFSSNTHFLRNGKKVSGKLQISINDTITFADTTFQIVKIDPLSYNPDLTSFLKESIESIKKSSPKLYDVLYATKQELLKQQSLTNQEKN